MRNIYIGLFTVFMMMLMDVFARFGVVVLGAAPSIYASLSLFTAGVVLLIIAGPGRLGVETLKSPYTWLYAFLQIAFAVSEIYTFSLSTTTEGNILYRSTIVVSLLFSWLMFGRKPMQSDFIGSVIILAGCGYVAWQLPVETRGLVILSLVIGVVLFDLRNKVMEVHDTSNKSDSIKDQSRVTGAVLTVTSLLFMIFYAVVGYVVDSMSYSTVLPGLPSIEDFRNVKGLLGAVVAGVFIIAAAKYLLFYCTRTLKTENYIMLTAFILPMTFAAEWLFAYFDIMPMYSVQTDDLIAGSIIMLASFWMIWVRQKKEREQ